jgi:hypothetical protein
MLIKWLKSMAIVNFIKIAVDNLKKLLTYVSILLEVSVNNLETLNKWEKYNGISIYATLLKK